MACNLTASNHIAEKNKERLTYQDQQKTDVYAALNQMGIINVATIFRNAFPELEVNIINDSTLGARKGQPAYLEAGSINLNEESFDVRAPLHEMSHLFLMMAYHSSDMNVKKSRGELLKLAKRHIESKSSVYTKVLMRAPRTISKSALVEEVATELLSHRVSNKTDMVPDADKSVIKRFWKWIVGKLLGAMGVYSSKELRGIDYDSIYSLANVFDRHVFDWVNGLNQSNLSKYQMQGILDMLDAEFLAFGATKATKLSDIGNLAMRHSNPEQEVRAKLFRQYYSQLLAGQSPKPYSLKANGKQYRIDISKYIESSTDSDAVREAKAEKRRQIMTDVANKMTDDNRNGKLDLENRLIDHLNNPKKLFEMIDNEDAKSVEETFEGRIKIPGLVSLLNYMGYTSYVDGNGVRKSYNKAMRLSEAIKTYPQAFNGFDMNSIGTDPTVLIHREITKGTEVVALDMSLVHLTFDSFDNDNLLYSNGLLFGEIASKTKLKAAHWKIPSSYRGAMQFIMGMQAYKMMSLNPKNIIRRHGMLNPVGNKVNTSMYSMEVMRENIIALEYYDRRLNGKDSLLNLLPDDIAALIRDPKTQAINIDVDYFQMILNTMLSERDHLRRFNKQSATLDDQIQMIEDWIVSPGNKPLMINALNSRLIYLRDLRKDHPETFDDSLLDEDIRNVQNGILMLLTPSGSITKDKKRDSNLLERAFIPGSNSPFIRTLINVWTNTDREIEGIVEKNMKEFHKRLDVYMKRNGYVVKRVGMDSGPTFEKLFEYYNESGEDLYEEQTRAMLTDAQKSKISTGVLITTEYAMNRANAKRSPSRQMTKEDLEFSRFIADMFDVQVRNSIRNGLKREFQNYKYDKVTKKYLADPIVLEQSVNDLYDSSWKYGRVPVLDLSDGELFSNTKFRKFVSGMFVKAGREENPQLDALKQLEKEYDSKRMSSIFSKQFNSTNAEAYWCDLMGVSFDGTDKVWMGKSKNGVLPTQNLERLMKTLIDDTVGQALIEEKVFPVIDHVKGAALDVELKMGIPQEGVKKEIKQTTKKITGEAVETLGKGKLGKTVELTTRNLLNINAILGTSFSFPVFAVSSISNITSTFLNSMANSWAGDPNNMFGIGNLIEAQGIIMTQPRLVESLMGIYQVYGREREDYLTYFNKTYKNWLTSRFPQFANYWSDYMARKVVMVAQMLKDGSFKAHSLTKDGDVLYDARKDKRYEEAIKNPNKSSSSKALMDHLREELQNDGRLNQMPGELPVRAYSLNDQKRFAFLAKEYVLSAYMKQQTPPNDGHLVVKMWKQFKKYLDALYDSRFGGMKHMEDGSYPIAFVSGKDENGDPIYGVKQQTFDREGTWRSVGKYLLNGVGMFHGIRLLDAAGKEMTPGSWRIKTPQQKFATYRTILDACTIALGLLMVNIIGLFGDDDDEGKKLEAMKKLRVVRIFTDSFSTYVALTPYDMKRNLGMDGTIFPVVGLFKSIMNAATFQAESKDYAKLTPFRSNVKLITEFRDNMVS